MRCSLTCEDWMTLQFFSYSPQNNSGCVTFRSWSVQKPLKVTVLMPSKVHVLGPKIILTRWQFINSNLIELLMTLRTTPWCHYITLHYSLLMITNGNSDEWLTFDIELPLCLKCLWVKLIVSSLWRTSHDQWGATPPSSEQSQADITRDVSVPCTTPVTGEWM